MKVETGVFGELDLNVEEEQAEVLTKEIIEQLDEQEYFLAKKTTKNFNEGGLNAYLNHLTRATYHIAREVAKMSPNERVVFDDALKRFEAVQGGSK